MDDRDLRDRPQDERREALERLFDAPEPADSPDADDARSRQAVEWLEHFEGAGLDGVIAKPAREPYLPGKRAMVKIKHVRTADCVVAGFRWHKSGKDAIGSLLLGLYDRAGSCNTSA